MRRIAPGPGQESVWDYPRPPRVERSERRIVVRFGNETIADSIRSYRVLETSHPPVFYVPQADCAMEHVTPTPHRTFCEFKGTAHYWTLTADGRVSPEAAWSYPSPSPGFEQLQDHLAFYPSRVDEAMVDDHQIVAQDGDFYGGWITPDIVGPFKGGVGTRGW